MNEYSKILTEQEKKLIRKLFIWSKIASPLFITSLVIDVFIFIPTMVIDITSETSANRMIGLYFMIIAPAIPFITWMITFIGSRIIVKGTQWGAILAKISQGRSDIDDAEKRRGQTALNAITIYEIGNMAKRYGDVSGAEGLGTTISGIMTANAIFDLMSKINKHAVKVAEITGVPLPKLSTAKTWVCILVIPCLAVLVIFSTVYGISGYSNYSVLKEDRNAKLEEIRTILSECADGYEVKVERDDYMRLGRISAWVEKPEDDAGISSRMLLIFDENDVLDGVHYDVEFKHQEGYAAYYSYLGYDKDYERPGKQEALDITINEITGLNNVLQKFYEKNGSAGQSNLTKLYLPSDGFTQEFLSTESWEDIEEEPVTLENVQDTNVRWSLDNHDISSSEGDYVYIFSMIEGEVS